MGAGARILAVVALALMLAAGCATFGATQVAEFRHPVTDEIKVCYDNPTNRAVAGVFLSAGAFDPGVYAVCKSQLERAGYVRVPVDPQVQAEVDRLDAARADSIRK